MIGEDAENQIIDYIVVDNSDTYFRVGERGVSKIDFLQKSGMYSYIPYIRVWSDGNLVAEFCQHNIIGVYFKKVLK